MRGCESQRDKADDGAHRPRAVRGYFGDEHSQCAGKINGDVLGMFSVQLSKRNYVKFLPKV